MRALLLALLLAAPLAAAGAGFVVLPSDAAEAVPCGPDVCVPLLPGEAAVGVAPGAGYAFLDAAGAILGSGCGGAPVDVPPSAVALVVSPGACEG